MRSHHIAELLAELSERREQYRAVIEHNPHPTWVYSFDTLAFLDVNDLAVRSYGWSREEFLAMTIADIRPREDVPALMADVTRMRGAPGGTSGPWRHVRKDGSVVQVDISFLTLPFSGRSARLVVVEARRAETIAGLSLRERQVLEGVARGHTSRTIARALSLSPKSVETYRARFMQKLSLRTRADIIRYALAHGVLGGGGPPH
jgi:PAS domain S-box-containing protein